MKKGSSGCMASGWGARQQCHKHMAISDFKTWYLNEYQEKGEVLITLTLDKLETVTWQLNLG
eukprot:7389828-Lingulodinium_polyedra.AAC.1